jgi:hypothetical protein
MSPEGPIQELAELERAWALPYDATPLMRALAYRPRCAAAGRHRNALVAKLCKELGIRPPWSTHVSRKQWPPSWAALKPWNDEGSPAGNS